MTMTLIETKTLGAAAASIEFTSIPQTFTDLVILISGRTARAMQVIDGNRLEFNSITTGYATRLLFGDGSSAASNTDTNAAAGASTGDSATANTFGNSAIYISNYTAATNKSYSSDGVSENNATISYQILSASLWSNTAAITSITIKSESASNYLIGTTVSLYGVLKGSDGIVTTS